MKQIGPYTLLREVGRGGMGVVFQARGPDGRDVALKLLLPQRNAEPHVRQRFQGEMRALARLRHPNLVALQATGEHEGRPWLALDYVDGCTLQDRLRTGPLPIFEGTRVALQLASALAYLHSCGVLHRDLKPDNVLLSGDQALLTDFGLALDDDSEGSRVTASGIFLGTPGYWAPEQATGDIHNLGPHTDVYGLGAVLYACLTGQAPVTASTLQDYLMTANFRSCKPPRELRPDVPPWLDALCMRCLAREPSERPSSADEVARALTLAAGPADFVEPSAKRGGVAIGVGLAAVVALGLGLAYSLRPDPTSESLSRPPAITPQDPTLPERTAANPATRGATAEAPAPSAPDTPPEVRALLEQALSERKAGRFAEAIAACDQALRLTPDDPGIHLIRAETHAIWGRFAEAIADADRSFELAPSLLALTCRAGVKLEAERYLEVLRDCALGVQLFPNAARLLRLRAHALLGLGKHREALETLDRLLQQEPTPQLHNDRGLALLKLNRAQEAVDAFSQALRLDPRLAFAQASRGAAKLRLRRYQAAIADCEAALRLDAELPLAFSVRGSARFQLGNAELALADFDRSLELDPNQPAVYYSRAIVHLDAGHNEAAIADFDRTLLANPGHVDALLNRGIAKVRLGRDEQGLADFGTLLELRPDDALALFNRATTLNDLDRHEEALSDLERSLRLDPKNRAAYLERSQAELGLARPTAALDTLARLLVLDPDHLDAHRLRARILVRLDRYAEALDTYTHALRLAPQDAKLHADRGSVNLLLRRDEAALRDLDRALELAPRSSSSFHRRGMIKTRLEQWAAAEADYGHAVEIDPELGGAYVNRAMVRSTLGRDAQALADCERGLALELSPNYAKRARALQARLLAKLRK